MRLILDARGAAGPRQRPKCRSADAHTRVSFRGNVWMPGSELLILTQAMDEAGGGGALHGRGARRQIGTLGVDEDPPRRARPGSVALSQGQRASRKRNRAAQGSPQESELCKMTER